MKIRKRIPAKLNLLFPANPASLPQVLNLLEITSVVLVLIYLYFAAKRDAKAWLFGIAASVCSAVLFYMNGYLGSMVLNLIYILQGILGYLDWKWLEPNRKAAYRLRIGTHVFILSGCFLLTYLVYKGFQLLAYNEMYSWDILLAAGSIVATFLEIRKESSCWWYWIVCNLGYALVYYVNPGAQGPLYLYTALMLILAGFSVYALRAWQISSKA